MIGWGSPCRAAISTTYYWYSPCIVVPLKFLIFRPALTIIAEYSFFLWDQEPSQGCVAAAVDLYMRSPNCSTVMKDVNAAFREHSGHIFKRNIFGQREVKKEFKQELLHIALDNCLCMSKCGLQWHQLTQITSFQQRNLIQILQKLHQILYCVCWISSNNKSYGWIFFN